MLFNIQLLTATLLTLSGVVLLFSGLWIDPEGEIHSSVLVAFGEISTFAGGLFGIHYCYRYRHSNPPKEKNVKSMEIPYEPSGENNHPF